MQVTIPSERLSFFEKLNSQWHRKALWLFMVVVFGHWAEHLLQVYQVYMLGWLPSEAGGMLGLAFPRLAQSEVLHMVYNVSLFAGVLLLRPAFVGRGRKWWSIALVFQTWHLFEHTLLQVQWLTGSFLFGAAQQTSILQLWVPRVELHFLYNLIVFIPMVFGLYYHVYPSQGESADYQCDCAH
jgi:hypothetical protein